MSEPSDPTKTLAPEQAKPRNKGGRPTTYTPEIAAEICKRLSEGQSLSKMTTDPKMPSQSTVYLWLLRHPEFSESYAQARDEQADTLADEIVAIADEPPAEIVDDKGISRIDSGWVTWQKNRVDARKWVAAKLKPKKYGDRQMLANDPDNPLIAPETSFLSTVIAKLESIKR